MDEFFASDVIILDILKFAMDSEIQYLVQHQKKLSIINSKVKITLHIQNICLHGGNVNQAMILFILKS